MTRRTWCMAMHAVSAAVNLTNSVNYAPVELTTDFCENSFSTTPSLITHSRTRCSCGQKYHRGSASTAPPYQSIRTWPHAAPLISRTSLVWSIKNQLSECSQTPLAQAREAGLRQARPEPKSMIGLPFCGLMIWFETFIRKRAST